MSSEDTGATVRVIRDVMKERIDRNPTGQAKHVPPTEVLRIAKLMQEYQGTSVERAEVFSRMYPDLVEQCPSLFQMACRDGMDMGMLEFMVNTCMTSDEEDGREKIGEALAVKYVKPPGDA